MRQIPQKYRKQMAADPYYTRCARQEAFGDHECQPDPMTGRLIEWEHAFIYSGRQIVDPWATVPLCWYVHRGPGLNKRINEFLALKRATVEDLKKYPNRDWVQVINKLKTQVCIT